MRFETELSRANWDDIAQRWNLTLNDDQSVTAKYLVLGLGPLSKTNYPDISGIHDFKGEVGGPPRPGGMLLR